MAGETPQQTVTPSRLLGSMMMMSVQDEAVVRGVIERVTFHNATNGYTVFRAAVADSLSKMTVVGTATNPQQGRHFCARGKYIDHPKFGKQFSATSIVDDVPSSNEGIERYLQSDSFKGIGPKTAAKLVEAFGSETIKVLTEDPERARKAAGLSKKRMVDISSALQQEEDGRESLRFLLEHGITQRMAHRIFEKYKHKTIELLKEDPYILARDLKGVGFLTADTIATQLGIRPDAPERLRAGVLYALDDAADDGHCFLTGEILSVKARALLRIDDSVDLTPHLAEVVRLDMVVQEGERFYAPRLHRAEEFVARDLRNRVKQSIHSAPSEILLSAIDEAEKALNVTLSDEQRTAVRAAHQERVLVITGGPGCGKTTVVRAIVATLRSAHKRITLAAPTGRAAQRLAQMCDSPASTIHRLLKFNPHSGQFLFGFHDQLPTDVVIIDEASMLDITLAKDLLSAIPAEATVIFVGDKDQLPSVGPGRFFGDLIGSDSIKTITFSRLFRREQGSSINEVAFLINAGTVPSIPEPDGVTKSDAYFLQREKPEDGAALIEKLVSEQLPAKFGFSPQEIVVLTPTNRGELGTLALNMRLQAKLNPPDPSRAEVRVGENTFRVGDRVCQRVNNYKIDETGVFNGDTGTIVDIDTGKRELFVELWDGRVVTYTELEIGELSLAYAVTVHRSQGSEIPCVVLALHHSQYSLLDRQLTYTGITRAKKLLIIVGSHRALSMGTRKHQANQRLTALKEKIDGVIPTDNW